MGRGSRLPALRPRLSYSSVLTGSASIRDVILFPQMRPQSFRGASSEPGDEE